MEKHYRISGQKTGLGFPRERQSCAGGTVQSWLVWTISASSRLLERPLLAWYSSLGLLHGCAYSVVSTLCDPMNCSLWGSSVHGILQTRILEWAAIPFFRRSSLPRDQTCVFRIGDRFLPAEPLESPYWLGTLPPGMCGGPGRKGQALDWLICISKAHSLLITWLFLIID